MKARLEFVLLLFVVILFATTDFCARHAQTILFSLGFLAITVGFALAWSPLGLIVPGTIICGLLIWDATMPAPLPPKKKEGDHA